MLIHTFKNKLLVKTNSVFMRVSIDQSEIRFKTDLDDVIIVKCNNSDNALHIYDILHSKIEDCFISKIDIDIDLDHIETFDDGVIINLADHIVTVSRI